MIFLVKNFCDIVLKILQKNEGYIISRHRQNYMKNNIKFYFKSKDSETSYYFL
jgi:hypothetical protein